MQWLNRKKCNDKKAALSIVTLINMQFCYLSLDFTYSLSSHRPAAFRYPSSYSPNPSKQAYRICQRIFTNDCKDHITLRTSTKEALLLAVRSCVDPVALRSFLGEISSVEEAFLVGILRPLGLILVGSRGEAWPERRPVEPGVGSLPHSHRVNACGIEGAGSRRGGES